MSLQKNIVAAISNLTENGLVIKSVNWITGEITVNVVSVPDANNSPAIDDWRIIGPTRVHGFATDNVLSIINGPLTYAEYQWCARNPGAPGAKIEAIKFIRNSRNISLASAKSLVESNYDFPVPVY